MSDINSLSELANFIAKSPLASEDMVTRQKAVNAIRGNLQPQPARRKVVDLLGTVLALSSRTRRVVQPRARVELDVFTPENTPAVVISLATH